MWDKEQLLEEFDVLGFSFGLCVVKRKSDGVRGTLDFTTDPSTPRTYFNFQEAV